DLQPRSTFPAPLGPTCHAEESSHLAHIQLGAGPVDHALKNLVHLRAAPEEQVATVLHLVNRVGVVEACPFQSDLNLVPNFTKPLADPSLECLRMIRIAGMPDAATYKAANGVEVLGQDG